MTTHSVAGSKYGNSWLNASRLPSLDHRGEFPCTPGLSCVTDPPSAAMTASSKPPYRSVSKTIREPSGDQSGLSSFPGDVVSCANLVPSAFTAQISRSPLTVYHGEVTGPMMQVNATRVLSGDHVGCVANPTLISMRTRLEPSAFITYRATGPSRSLANAIRVPSGDQAGVKYVAGWLVRFSCVPPVAGITKMSLPPLRIIFPLTVEFLSGSGPRRHGLIDNKSSDQA